MAILSLCRNRILLVKLKSSNFTVATMTGITATLYMCHKSNDHGYVCRNHKPFLSLFLTYHWICIKSNTTDVNREPGIAYPSRASDVNLLDFSEFHVPQSFVFSVVLCRYIYSISVFDYLFGVFKLLLL